jgi:hypothetical protein
MTAASDHREELEACLWRNGIPAPLVAEILAAADDYAKSSRPREPKPAAPRKPLAVHYALAGTGHSACRPFDLLSANNWLVTADLKAVTCGHCKRILDRAEAVGSP